METPQCPADLSPAQVVSALAHSLAALGAATTAVGGCIAFEVAGPQGGSWSVDLSTPGGRWCQGIDEAYATLVRASESAFAALVSAPEQVASLLAAGEFRVTGDRARLSALGRMLGQGGSALAQRLRTKSQQGGQA